MSFSELSRIIEIIGKERGIEKDIVVRAVEQAFLVTARKKYGIQGEYETRYNEEDDDIEIYQYKNVVDSIRDPILEIDLQNAQVLDKNIELGDQVGVRIENPNFTRVDVQTARQIIFQKVRDAEREIIFADFKHKEGELVTGIARRYERGNIVVDLGKAEALLPRRETIPGEQFRTGDRIQAYLSEVTMTNRGPEVRLSRTSPLFLVKLFAIEVPEVSDGTIQVRSAAREPGFRAKIAVTTSDKDIDPVGACVGMKGSRVQNIVNELQGEKIDIVRWNNDIIEFTKLALAPADITNIMYDTEDSLMDVVVEEDQLALAIGRRGQNVRLASMLTGNRINIISKTKLQEKIQKSVDNLLQISGISETHAQVLVQQDVLSVADFAALNAENISQTLGLSKDDAQDILKKTLEHMESDSMKLHPEEDEELVAAHATPLYKGFIESNDSTQKTDKAGKFLEAEKRLREELAGFKLK